MDASFTKAVELVLKHEGLFSNDPADPGGPTNYGISLRFLQNLKEIDPGTGYLVGDLDHDGDVDVDDIRKMTVPDASRIYKTQWWERYRYGLIDNEKIAAKLLDFSVNMGPGRAHRIIQEAYNKSEPAGPLLKVDGNLGPVTISTINHDDEPLLVLAMFRIEAIRFYASLNKARFIQGWINRALD